MADENNNGGALGSLWNSITGQTAFQVAPSDTGATKGALSPDEYQAYLTAYNNGTLPKDDEGNPVAMGDFQRMLQQQRVVQSGQALNNVLQQQQANTSILQQQAQGKGPNVAGDEAQQRAFGLASSGNVAPGQRAAMLSAAANQAPQLAAQARGQQMTNAASLLNQATAGQTQTLGQQQQAYGSVMNTGEQNMEANQRALQSAAGINAGVQQSNAANEGKSVGGMIAAAGGAAAMMSDMRSKDDIVPMAPMAPSQPYAPATYQPPSDGGGGGGMAGIGSMMGGMMSDERSKDRIRELEGALAQSQRDATAIRGTAIEYPMASPTAIASGLATPSGSREALAPVQPYEYRYKPGVAAAIGEDTAPRTGVMAQDLERSPYFRDAVATGPDGYKRIDPQRLLSGTAAATAGLDKRLRLLEAASGQGDQIRNIAVPYPTSGGR